MSKYVFFTAVAKSLKQLKIKMLQRAWMACNNGFEVEENWSFNTDKCDC